MAEQVEQIGIEKKAELYWEEWKYRHDVYWKSLNLWGGAVIFLLIGPYTGAVNLTDLGYYVFVFPALAFLLSLFAGWQLAAEYARIVNVTKSLRDELPVYVIEPTTRREKILFYSIGKVVTRAFVLGLSALSIVDAIILSQWLGL